MIKDRGGHVLFCGFVKLMTSRRELFPKYKQTVVTGGRPHIVLGMKSRIVLHSHCTAKHFLCVFMFS